MLELRELVVRYGPIEAVRGVNLVANTGTITAVLGANGAGKSSLMKAISGVVAATSGSIRVDGEDVTRLPAHERARRGLSHALEGRRLFHPMTVEENLRLAWEFRRGPTPFRTAVERAYQHFPVLATRRSSLAGMLSGGQQQMLILSAALINEPRYLLLDEPSLGLAPLIVEQIFEFIANITKEQKTTVVLCEQMAMLALRVADFGYVLRRGQVVQSGPVAELAAEREISAAYLGGGNGRG
jgi:branched-chain amino acid transport system ATP-binding protein